MERENGSTRITFKYLVSKWPPGIFLLLLFALAPTATSLILQSAINRTDSAMGTEAHKALVLVVSLLASIVIVSALHELLHGLFFWLYTGHARIGIRWKTVFGPTPYATSNGSKLTRPRFIATALAPQLLSVVLFVLGAPPLLDSVWRIVLLSAALMNVAGGCVDFLVCIFAMTQHPLTTYSDDSAGVSVYPFKPVDL